MIVIAQTEMRPKKRKRNGNIWVRGVNGLLDFIYEIIAGTLKLIGWGIETLLWTICIVCLTAYFFK